MDDYAALKAEIDGDAQSLGYAGKSANEVADLLNQVGLNDQTIDRGSVATWEILAATEVADLEALTDKQQRMYQMVISTGTVPLHDARIRSLLLRLFNNGTATRTNLAALQIRPASRAEVLGWDGVAYWDVARARAL